jgi:hypothetical protein
MYGPIIGGAKLLHDTGGDVRMGDSLRADLWRGAVSSIVLAGSAAVWRHRASAFARRRVLHQLRP